MWLVLTACVFAISIVFSMLGMGGGALYTPVQAWLSIDFHQAATTSLFLIMSTSAAASIVFHKAKKIDWPLAATLETVTALGGFAGGLASAKFSGTTLSIFFAVIIGLASVFMIRPITQRHACPEHTGGFFAWKRTLGEQTYCVNLMIALPVSFAAGVISGSIGVGGGLIKVPLMVLLLGVPTDIAVGSSSLMVGLTAVGGFAGHLFNNTWNWKLSLILAAAVFIGGQIGSRITVQLNKNKLKRGFGWFLLIIAATMLLKAL